MLFANIIKFYSSTNVLMIFICKTSFPIRTLVIIFYDHGLLCTLLIIKLHWNYKLLLIICIPNVLMIFICKTSFPIRTLVIIFYDHGLLYTLLIPKLHWNYKLLLIICIPNVDTHFLVKTNVPKDPVGASQQFLW